MKEHTGNIVDTLEAAFSGQLIMLTCIYLLVIIVVMLDLWSGLRKARQRGEASSSSGLRKTVEKLGRYFNMMLVLTVIDAMQILAFSYLNPQINFRIPLLPILTFFGGVFVGIIEFKSIYERAADKEKSKFREAASMLAKLMAEAGSGDFLNRIVEQLKDKERNEN